MQSPHPTDGCASTTVLLVCGLPGSGKSFLCRKLMEAALQDEEDGGRAPNTNSRPRMHWLEYDAVEAELRREMKETAAMANEATGSGWGEHTEGRVALEAWRKAREAALMQLDRHLEEESARPSDAPAPRRRLILLDDNFHLRSMRKRAYQLCARFAHKATIYLGVVWVEASLETCLERNRRRPHPVSDSVVEKLAKVAEPPLPLSRRPDRNPHRGPYVWEAACLCVSGETRDSDRAVEEVQSFVASLPASFGCVVRPQEPEEEEFDAEARRRRPPPPARHTADLALRRCVRAAAQCHPALGRTCNEIRRALLDEERVGAFTDDGDLHGRFWRELSPHLPEDWTESQRRCLERRIRAVDLLTGDPE